MKTMIFAQAIESALAQAMAEDPRIIIMGEDVKTLRRNLMVRFGEERVLNTPISESAFLGAAVTASMSGLRPVVEIMLVDFIGVAMDALLNHAAKNTFFSGGQWQVPIVVRTACGGGYGDAGQHEQSLWGWLSHIPGLNVVVPSNPAEAGGLMLSALESPEPVIFMEHKLLADDWLDYMGRGGRNTVQFDVPEAGRSGQVPKRWEALPIGESVIVREGSEITLISLGVGVHRCLEAGDLLQETGVQAEILNLRSVQPLDRDGICRSVKKTGCVVVVDEDYQTFGLSGEIAAVLMESGISAKYSRVCIETTIPYARHRENQTVPNVDRIIQACNQLLD